jgi:hypothetical protein
MLLTYDQMKVELARFKIPSIGAVVGKLSEIGAAAVVCAAIAKAHPKDYRKRLSPLSKDTSWLLPTALHSKDSPISSTISRLINDHLFPVDEFWLDEEQMDYREDATIHPGLYQHRMTFDEFSDMVSSDPSELSDYAGFPLITCMLGGWLDEEFDRYWTMYNRRFQWGIPDVPSLPDHDYYLNLKVFKRELKQRGISPLYTLFLAIDGNTGNVFFDFDYEMEMPPTVTPATLDHLHQEWKRSQPLAKECDQALDLITTDPQIYIKFLDAYQASLRKRKE